MAGIRIAFVLCLVDDFSGEPIRKDKFLFISRNQVLHAIHKGEGMYVFLEPKEEEVRLLVQGTDYYPKEIAVKKRSLDPLNPVLSVRLYGRPEGKFSYHCDWLTGTLEEQPGGFPAEVIAGRIRPTGLSFVQYREDEGQPCLSFRGFTKENLTGRPYILGGVKKPVPFVLSQRRGINEYCADLEGVSLGDVKQDAPLIRIYRSLSDSSGNYAIPVESKEECRILLK